MTPARFEDRKEFLVAGLAATYHHPNIEGIPAQWDKFEQHLGKIPGQVDSTAYGICFNMDSKGKMDYLCGVEVATPPEGLSVLKIEATRYAVFEHRDHISKIKQTWMSILNDWGPTANVAWGAPQVEAYGSDFNPATGPVEIWIPVAGK